jgi:group I intron endonuclease
MGLIYKATSKTSGKSYIGLTSRTLEERKQEHYYQAKGEHKTYAFYNAISKYGFDDFEWTIIFETDDFNELQRYECYFIGKHNTFENGYNSTVGGEGFLGVTKPKGEQNWKSKISDETAKEIVRLLTETDLSSREISEITGVGKSTVRNIANGSSWTHLYAIPPKQQKERKHIRAVGMNAPTTKLTENEVLEIRRLYKNGMSGKDISEKFPHVERSNIYRIVKYQTWKHLKEVE